MISLIVAYAKNRVIGCAGRIPWDIKGEKSRFKRLTTNNTVIMGRLTYEEIGKNLPNRETIVISTTKCFTAPHCITVSSLSEALACAKGDVFIAGGEMLYKEAFPLCSSLYITEIHAIVKGDRFFPLFDESLYNKKIEKEVFSNIPYTYLTYTKK